MPPSQQTVNAYVSMIMVNLPFPPLPVCGARGEGRDKEDALVSGHDLLSRAIACTLLDPQTRDPETTTQTQQRKSDLLRAMHTDVAAIWARDLGTDDRVRLCYEKFCSFFRAYMRLYPGPDDLRIMPLGMVDAKSVLCVQAREHLRARQQLCPSTGHTPSDGVYSGMRYYDLIALYASDLHAASN